MKLNIEKTCFCDLLQKIQYVHEKKGTLDIIHCVLIETEQNQIKVTATDLETSYKNYTSAKIYEPGLIAVNSRKLLEIIREMPSEEINLFSSPDNTLFVIKGGSSTFKLPTRPPEDFPNIPFFENEKLNVLDSTILGKMLGKVLFSVPEHKASANIPGLVLRETTPEKIDSSKEDNKTERLRLQMFSIDIHRMVNIERDFEVTGLLNLSSGVILPRKGVRELLNLTQEGDNIYLGVKDNFLVARKDLTSLTIRLIDDKIPSFNINSLSETPYQFIINKMKMIEILRRAIILKSDFYRHIILTLKDDRIYFYVNNPDIGTIEEDLGIKYDGPELEIAFNMVFLLEAISNMESDFIRIGLKNSESPFIFTGEDDKYYISVLMPVVLTDEE